MIGQRALDLFFVKKQVAVTENGGEKIVEVVSDSGGKLTKRFHSLGTAKLVLKLFARGHVHQRTDQVRRGAVVIAKNQRALQNVNVGSIRAAKTIFAAPL